MSRSHVRVVLFATACVTTSAVAVSALAYLEAPPPPPPAVSAPAAGGPAPWKLTKVEAAPAEAAPAAPAQAPPPPAAGRKAGAVAAIKVPAFEALRVSTARRELKKLGLVLDARDGENRPIRRGSEKRYWITTQVPDEGEEIAPGGTIEVHAYRDRVAEGY